MLLEVERTTSTGRSTTGILSIDGQQQCYTLEPPKVADPNGNGFICIPAGTFSLTIRWSPKNKRQVPHVENVPGRTEIEIHIGNYPDDTDGCTLVGTQLQPDIVLYPEVAFSALMTKLFSVAVLRNPSSPEVNQIWDVGSITYTEAP